MTPFSRRSFLAAAPLAALTARSAPAKYSKVDDATIAKMTRAVYAESLQPSELDPTLEWSACVKFIDRPVSAREIIAIA